jgi:polyhydroxyalkanoate synthase subunit PhaC
MSEHARPDVDAISQQGAPGGFELVLASAAFRTISDHIPGHELRAMAAALVQHPGPALTPVIDLARQLVPIVLGSDGQPTSRDRRFADPAWRTNPLLRRIALGYLASCQAVERIVADAEVDWRTKERVKLLADNLLAAAAPTNNPVLHPLSWQRAIDTGGRSWLRGLQQLVIDMGAPPRLPATVDTTAFSIGENIAATPGKVVWRSELFELIQYAPTAETVDETPVLFVASPVNKYYLLDLSPHRSVIAAELACGRQVFVISWVNPDQRHSDAGLDEYVSSILDSLDAIDAITGGDRAHLLGLCGGGQLAVAVVGYLAATGRQARLATLTLAITVVDFERGGPQGALIDRKVAKRAIARATKDGLFDGKNSAVTFAWLRPNDGIWANVVNDYLLGQQPPAEPLLYWAADQTNLALQLGVDLLEMVVGNGFAAGTVRVLDQAIDLRNVTVDTYVLGASTDHISPWPDCYRTRALLGGSTTFVLARGGHAVAVATPPGNPKASYRTGTSSTSDPEQWLAESTDNPGSWWEHWNQWIQECTPTTRPAPTTLGSVSTPVLAEAPGAYVRAMLA